VAVGLLENTIADDLTSDLTGVYNNTDPRAYPLSSYSYMIIPTSTQKSFTEAKGKTLGAFAYYFLCEGQQQAPALGYSPLPINLVQAGFDQIPKIPGAATQSVDISQCNNPTFSATGENTLALTAPQPEECDKKGDDQCLTGTGGAAGTANSASASAAGKTSKKNGSSSGTSDLTTLGGPISCNADTGVCVSVVADSVSVSGEPQWTVQETIMALSVILFVLIIVAPPIMSRVVAARGKR
jgi:hypothetical protein